jgi:hypothetical protein
LLRNAPHTHERAAPVDDANVSCVEIETQVGCVPTIEPGQRCGPRQRRAVSAERSTLLRAFLQNRDARFDYLYLQRGDALLLHQ